MTDLWSVAPIASVVCLPVCLFVTRAHIQCLHDTVDDAPPDEAIPSSFRYQPNSRYFVSDLSLEQSNALIQTALLPQVQSAPRLLDVLRGGMFQHFDDEFGLPHGVCDWTTTHLIDNGSGSGSSRRSSSSAAKSGDATGFRPYHPIYFHVEAHQSGAVNWRTRDMFLHVDSRPSQQATVLCPSAAMIAVPQAAYWICPLPDGDNLRNFHDAMARLPSVRSQLPRGTPYSVTNIRQPSLRSLEPLLRAGVCFSLVRQLENELVVLAPGTPHWVLTPAAATKISRNWISPLALLQRAHRTSHGRGGERDEWIADLCRKPYLGVMRALRRWRAMDERAFQALLQDPTSRIKLHLILSDIDRARLLPDERRFSRELQETAQQMREAALLHTSVTQSMTLQDPSMRAPDLPPRLTAAEVVATQQLAADAEVEESLADLHQTLPLETVRALPGMKQAKRNPTRQVAISHSRMRTENRRRLREAQQAAIALLNEGKRTDDDSRRALRLPRVD